MYVYRFIKKTTGNPVWVAWWDGYTQGDTRQVSINGISDNQVVVTNSVPNYSTGAEVTDYNTAFITTTLDVSNNSVTIVLDSTPVFIEEASDVSIDRGAGIVPIRGIRLYQTTGNYSVVWDGKNNHGNALNTGFYFYELKSDNGSS